MTEQQVPGPIAPPHRARCDGCRLTWDVGMPFDDHGKPHVGCRLGGVWIISQSEMQRLLDEARENVERGDYMAIAEALTGIKHDPNYGGGPVRRENTPQEETS